VPTRFAELLAALTERRDLGDADMAALVRDMLSGRLGEAEVAAFLVALRMKGETAGEIAAAAAVIREHMVRLEAGRPDVLDTCGTGGDGAGTFNISTAAALVAAGAGVPVVKHGNRAVSGHTGSADVLALMGVTIDGDPAWTRRCLDAAGLAFCFAPHFHPALRHVSGVRRRLGVRTLFNALGPLANPAGAPYQLVGVGRREWLDPVAGALARLGTRRAVVVSGDDGLDEVTLSGPTRYRDVRDGVVTAGEWSPRDFGLAPCSLDDLRVRGVGESAARIRDLLEGRAGPCARVVLANAAAALLACGRVGTLAQGVEQAAAAVAGGRARDVLDRLIACSRMDR
jgi:anthranilate phosphoribosyltransferase